MGEDYLADLDLSLLRARVALDMRHSAMKLRKPKPWKALPGVRRCQAGEVGDILDKSCAILKKCLNLDNIVRRRTKGATALEIGRDGLF